MTTQTGSKLTASVRRAKTTQVKAEQAETTNENAEATESKPAAKTTRTTKAPVRKKPLATTDEAVSPMPSNRVWPD